MHGTVRLVPRHRRLLSGNRAHIATAFANMVGEREQFISQLAAGSAASDGAASVGLDADEAEQLAHASASDLRRTCVPKRNTHCIGTHAHTRPPPTERAGERSTARSGNRGCYTHALCVISLTNTVCGTVVMAAVWRTHQACALIAALRLLQWMHLMAKQ